jgi:hypothetical protein
VTIGVCHDMPTVSIPSMPAPKPGCKTPSVLASEEEVVTSWGISWQLTHTHGAMMALACGANGDGATCCIHPSISLPSLLPESCMQGKEGTGQIMNW